MYKILVAEDELVMSRVVAHYIEDLGHVAIIAANGKLALEILENNPDISVLITDVQMPLMTGSQLIHKVRAIKKFNKLPIVLMSAVASWSEIKELLEFGASEYLRKPFAKEVLRKSLVRCNLPVPKNRRKPVDQPLYRIEIS